MYGLTKKEQKALVVRLKEIKAGDYNPEVGVCGNIKEFPLTTTRLFKDLGYKDCVYPLSGPSKFIDHSFGIPCTLWKGYQKKKRMKLVDQMIELLEVK